MKNPGILSDYRDISIQIDWHSAILLPRRYKNFLNPYFSIIFANGFRVAATTFLQNYENPHRPRPRTQHGRKTKP